MRSRATRSSVIIACCAASLALPHSSIAQSVAPVHQIRPAVSAIELDGVLVEEAWREAERIVLAYEWFPGENTPPPVHSECRVTFEPQRLLVGCRAADSQMSELRAAFSDRDALGSDDQFVLLIDATDDQRTAYRFAVNPLGVQADALVLQGRADDSWDTIWESAAHRDATGWSVEVAIPFSSLQFPTHASRWGLIVERIWPRTARRRFGNVAMPRNENCQLCRAASLVGLAAVRSGNEIELNPSVTALRTHGGDDPAGGVDFDAGLSAQWNATPSTRIAATINPDFSQVEADADELDVNVRFAIQFPEKRPFFTEGEDFFETFGNLDLVFTRTIADPSAGLKTAGKTGAHAYGALVTRDEINNILLPGSQSSDITSVDQPVHSALLRYRLDAGRSSSLGAIATIRNADEYSNAVAGLDGLLRWSRHRFRYHVVASRTDYPASLSGTVERTDPFQGAATYARYDFDGRNWGAELSYRATGTDFRADAGFVPRVNVRGPELQLRRMFWGDDVPWFDRIDLAIEAQDLREMNGLLLDRKVAAQVAYQGPAQTEIEAGVFRRESRFAGQLFELTGTEMSAATQPAAALSLAATLVIGGEIDSDNVRPADLIDVRLGGSLRAGARMRLNSTYRWQRLGVAEGRIYSAHLPQLRVEYHFARDVFLRSILQYRRTEREPERFLEPVARVNQRMFVQILFAWRTNPRTVFFAGYADHLDGTGQLDSSSRSLFVKLAYAWRL